MQTCLQTRIGFAKSYILDILSKPKNVNNQITNDINAYKEENPAFAQPQQPMQQQVQQQMRYQPPGAENPALKQQREAQFQNFFF